MRERERYSLPRQQSERHYKLRYPADVRLELAVLDLHLQHASLRKPGERKLSVPISRDLQRRPADADSEGVLSELTMTALGQTRKSGRATGQSALPSRTDIVSRPC